MTLLNVLKNSSEYNPGKAEIESLSDLSDMLLEEEYVNGDEDFLDDTALVDEEILTNTGYDSLTALSIVSERVVSRTTAGGRRRKFSVEAVRTTYGPYVSFAVSQRAKSVERFLAMEKLSSIPAFITNSDTFESTRIVSHVSGFRPYNCVFLSTGDYTKIPGNRPTTKTRSTTTQMFTPKTGFDVAAEPVQYRVLKSLNFRAFFLKNRGARHPRTRILNLLSILSLYVPRSLVSRRYGRWLD